MFYCRFGKFTPTRWSIMTTTAGSLTDRYSRLEASDLKAIIESPEGDYLPEAREAARAELAGRAQTGEPEELPAAPPSQSRAVTFSAILMVFAGGSLIFQGDRDPEAAGGGGHRC
jgi:hypothetical protein